VDHRAAPELEPSPRCPRALRPALSVLVFLPLAWWHQVTGLDISLSVSYTNIDLPNEYEYIDPQIRDW